MGELDINVPTPLDYFESLVCDDAHFPLMEAAIAIAQIDHPGLDVQDVLSRLDRMGSTLAGRLAQDAPPMHRLRVLNQYFFKDQGFAGNVNDFYDVANSYVHRVLETRRGIPITLALVYMELASHIGLRVRGVSFPGHFLAKLRLSGGEVVVDPFNGRSLSREELEERLMPYRRRRGLLDDGDVPLGLFLQAAPARDIIGRMLGNLKEIHLAREDWPRLLAVQHRLVRLLPQAWEERRDRGLTHGEMANLDDAIADLEVYLSHCPAADDSASVRERLEELRSSRAPRLH
jgi:regulator of sirC expression with transglutaminase-like and TPR domain